MVAGLGLPDVFHKVQKGPCTQDFGTWVRVLGLGLRVGYL